jgi:muconolactone delta-isomerase
MSETTAEGTIREALEVAVRILDTDWEPADLDRDVVDPLRAALAALDHLLAQEARVRALVEYKRKQGRYNSIMGLISPDELEAVLDQPQKESTG